jgi:hypothetical protein
MSLDIAIWLYGACAAGIVGAFAFAWRAHVAAGKCTEELYQYRLHAAEYFASFTHTAALETRTVTALNEIKESLKGQSQKLDRLVERGAR